MIEKGEALRRARLRLAFLLVVGTIIAMVVFAARVKIAIPEPARDNCKRVQQCITIVQCGVSEPADDTKELLKQYRSN